MQMQPITRKVTTRVPDRDFIRVGRSRIEGKGVFAKRKIPRGSRIIEYIGTRVPVAKLFAAVPGDGKPAAVYAFRLNDTTVIDGARGGNDSRFINHSCDPNCETYCFDDHLYVYAMRDITRGEELTFDYRLGTENGRRSKKRDLVDHACRCGSPNCRGTMVAPRRRRSP
jgi:SET domain-containing protein